MVEGLAFTYLSLEVFAVAVAWSWFHISIKHIHNLLWNRNYWSSFLPDGLHVTIRHIRGLHTCNQHLWSFLPTGLRISVRHFRNACSIVVSIKLFPVSPRSFVRGHAPSGESKEVKVVKGARELEEKELELENPRLWVGLCVPTFAF